MERQLALRPKAAAKLAKRYGVSTDELVEVVPVAEVNLEELHRAVHELRAAHVALRTAILRSQRYKSVQHPDGFPHEVERAHAIVRTRHERLSNVLSRGLDGMEADDELGAWFATASKVKPVPELPAEYDD